MPKPARAPFLADGPPPLVRQPPPLVRQPLAAAASFRSARGVTSVDLLAPAFGAADGYGHSAMCMAVALERMGRRVQLTGLVRRTGDLVPDAMALWERRRMPGQQQGDALVCYSQPTSWMPQIGRKNVGFSMYETDALPSEWMLGTRTVDEVWVPSRWLVEPFARMRGDARDVHVIPLGVDGAAFPYARRTRGAFLTFLHFAAAGGDHRKGADLAIRAFLAAFPGRADVRLVLRSTYTQGALVTKPDPRIDLVCGVISHADLLAEYHAADALVYPSRGEGFGMIPLEAMATGMPAIFADATGPADYASLGLTVPAARAPAPGYGGEWYEPDFAAIVERMREVDRDYERVMDDAEFAALAIREEWTWERTASAIVARLNA